MENTKKNAEFDNEYQTQREKNIAVCKLAADVLKMFSDKGFTVSESKCALQIAQDTIEEFSKVQDYDYFKAISSVYAR